MSMNIIHIFLLILCCVLSFIFDLGCIIYRWNCCVLLFLVDLCLLLHFFKGSIRLKAIRLITRICLEINNSLVISMKMLNSRNMSFIVALYRIDTISCLNIYLLSTTSMVPWSHNLKSKNLFLGLCIIHKILLKYRYLKSN